MEQFKLSILVPLAVTPTNDRKCIFSGHKCLATNKSRDGLRKHHYTQYTFREYYGAKKCFESYNDQTFLVVQLFHCY